MVLDRASLFNLVTLLEQVPGSSQFNVRTALLDGAPIRVTRNEGNARVDLLTILGEIDRADPISLLTVIENARFLIGAGQVVSQLEQHRDRISQRMTAALRQEEAVLAAGLRAGPARTGRPEALISALGLHDFGDWMGRINRAARTVGLVMVDSSARGTAFLVGPDLILTNYHVVLEQLTGSAPARGVKIRFDWREQPGASAIEYKESRLHPDRWLLDASAYSARESDGDFTPSEDELDYALLRLERDLGSDLGWLDLRRSPPPCPPGAPIFILQHPGGDPLRIAIDSALQTNANATRVRYAADTDRGSSGSPCFDARLDLVAMHHFGNQARRYNQGIPIAAIQSRMRKNTELRPLVGS